MLTRQVALAVRNPPLAVAVTQRLAYHENFAGGPTQFTVPLLEWILEHTATRSRDAAQAYAIGLWNEHGKLSKRHPRWLTGAILRHLEVTISTYDAWTIPMNPFKPIAPRGTGYPVGHPRCTGMIMHRTSIPQRLMFPCVRDIV